MSLLTNLVSLFDESDGQSFDKKIVQALDNFEATVTGSINKLESGVKKAETSFNKVDTTLQKVVITADKVMHDVAKPRLQPPPKTGTAMDIVQPNRPAKNSE